MADERLVAALLQQELDAAQRPYFGNPNLAAQGRRANERLKEFPFTEDETSFVSVNPLMARKAEAIKRNAPAENMLTQYAETMPQNWQQFGQNMAQAYPTPATGGTQEQIMGAVSQAAMNAGPGITSLIKDWRWRPLKDVSADLNIKEVPKYIQEGYGAFMSEQAKRAAAGDLGARDLIKAYGITRSSVNRAGRQMSDDLASGFTRPEGYMSEWFSSPAGKSYLDAAQSGKVDAAAIDDLVGRFQPFGMSQVLGKDLEYAAQKLPQINGSINDLVQGSVPEWRKFAQGIYGIGPAKSGFLPSMLGRGDIPTLDARQLNLHTLDSGDSASKFMRRQGGAGGDQAVDRLASRQQKMNLEISPELQPFYQHLTHHAVWDKIGNSITTHSDIVKAMLTAGIAPIAIPGLVEIVMREKGID